MSRAEEKQPRDPLSDPRAPLVREVPVADQRHHHPDPREPEEGLKVLYG